MFLRGQVVRSVAGRDKDYLMVVTGCDETYVYVCEGKERRLAKPKRKNPSHVEITPWNLDENRMSSDRRVRKALRELESDNE